MASTAPRSAPVRMGGCAERATASVVANPAGWDPGAQKFVQKVSMGTTACHPAIAKIILFAVLFQAVFAATVSRENSATFGSLTEVSCILRKNPSQVRE